MYSRQICLVKLIFFAHLVRFGDAISKNHGVQIFLKLILSDWLQILIIYTFISLLYLLLRALTCHRNRKTHKGTQDWKILKPFLSL